MTHATSSQRLLAAIAACLFMYAPASHAQAPRFTDGELRIGVLTDMASIASDASGAGSVLAAQMAIDDFNAEAKPAFRTKLLSADMQNKADVGASIARSWFDQDGVDMIVDIPHSAVALAVMRLAEEKNRVLLLTGPGSTRITGDACIPNAMQWVYDSYSQSVGLARALIADGAETWYQVVMDNEGGKAMQDEMTRAIVSAKAKVLGQARHPYAAPDFSSYVIQAQASGAKAIALINSNSDMKSFIKQAAEFGISKKQTLVPTMLHANDVDALGLELTQGMTVIDAFYWDRTAESRAWSKRFFDKRKKMPTLDQAGVYSATLHYLRAVKAAGTDEAGAVVARMKTAPVSDMFAQNGRIRPDGKMVHDMFLLEVKKPSESRYPWDFMKVKAVIPADQAFESIADSKCPLVRK